MRLLSLFSGVGMLDVAVEAAFGARTVMHCEQNAHCQRVLARHWPGVPCWPDVTTLTGDALPRDIDVICGGFPCQDLSIAGKRAGIHGARSGLWWKMLRVIREARPSMVVIENSPELYRKREAREAVDHELRDLGYRVEWLLLSAAAVGAPHRRMRAWVLAVREGEQVPEVQAPASQPFAGCMWPTPTVVDATGRSYYGGIFMALPRAVGPVVLPWATPCARDWRSGQGRQENGHTPQLCEQVAGVLNPGFVESLMGWPIDWTAAEGPSLHVEAQAILRAPRWPAPRVEGRYGRSPQYEWEPPRTVAPKTLPNRRAQLQACGNGVVPQCVLAALDKLAEAHRTGRTGFTAARQGDWL